MSIFNKIRRINSENKNVSKFVFEKSDAVAEAVLYKYPTYEKRTVICCSTQSGCNVGCRFCGSGDYFVRSLTAEEIVAQPDHLLGEIESEEFFCPPELIEKLQIMFMSMGEPLLNWKNVKEAIQILNKKYSNANLLLSTIGPKLSTELWNDIIQTSVNIPRIGLQFSIHESSNKKRNKLIPFKNKLSLKEIAEVGLKWSIKTGRKAFFNYCAHDKNTSENDADILMGYFDKDHWNATISVVCERNENVAASNNRQRDLACNFRRLLDERGFNTRTFDPAGQDDIGGGCGQLWFVQDWMKINSHLAKPSVGNGLPVLHTPQ